MTKLTLHDYQVEAVFRAVTELTKSVLVGAEIGAGKTLFAIETLRDINPNVTLIIAPKNTHDGWQKAFAKQEMVKPVIIDGTKRGKSELANYKASMPGVYLIGPELFARWAFVKNQNGGRNKTKAWTEAQPDVVIFDESHRASNRKSLTWKALMQLEPEWKIAMSGSWMGNSFEGAWAPTRWLWPNHVNPIFADWAHEWAATEYDPFSYLKFKIIGEKNPGAFAASLPCYIYFESKTEVETFSWTQYVEMTPRQRKVYERIQEESVVWCIDEAAEKGVSPLYVEWPISISARLLQCCLGEVVLDEDGNISYDPNAPSTTLDAAEDILRHEFKGETALLLSDSKRFVKATVARLTAHGFRAVEWSGDVPLARRMEIMQEWIDGKWDYVVAVFSALGEGVNGAQFATRNILKLSRPRGHQVLEEQTLGRVIRQGQDQVVRICTLETKDSVQQDGFQKLAQIAAARMASERI